jgi:hypothetical protein
MAPLKTRLTGRSVSAFVKGIRDPEQRRDARTLVALTNLADRDPRTLTQLIHESVRQVRARYGARAGRS